MHLLFQKPISEAHKENIPKEQIVLSLEMMKGISFLSLVSVPLDGLKQKEQGQGRKATDLNLVTVDLQYSTVE